MSATCSMSTSALSSTTTAAASTTYTTPTTAAPNTFTNASVPSNVVDVLSETQILQWYNSYVDHLYWVTNATATLHHYAFKTFRRRHRHLGIVTGVINGLGSLSMFLMSPEARDKAFGRAMTDSTLTAVAIVMSVMFLLNIVLSTIMSYVDYKTQSANHYTMYENMITLRNMITQMDIYCTGTPQENALLLERKYQNLVLTAPYVGTSVIAEVVEKWKLVATAERHSSSNTGDDAVDADTLSLGESSHDMDGQSLVGICSVCMSRAWTVLRRCCTATWAVCCRRQSRLHEGHAAFSPAPHPVRQNSLPRTHNHDRGPGPTEDALFSHHTGQSRFIRNIKPSKIVLLDQQLVVEWVAERMRMYNVRHPRLLQLALSHVMRNDVDADAGDGDGHGQTPPRPATNEQSCDAPGARDQTDDYVDVYVEDDDDAAADADAGAAGEETKDGVPSLHSMHSIRHRTHTNNSKGNAHVTPPPSRIPYTPTTPRHSFMMSPSSSVSPATMDPRTPSGPSMDATFRDQLNSIQNARRRS